MGQTKDVWIEKSGKNEEDLFSRRELRRLGGERIKVLWNTRKVP